MKILYLASKYKPEAYTGAVKFIDNITKHFHKKNTIKLVSYSEEYPTKYQSSGSIRYWNEIVDSIDCIKFFSEEKYRTEYLLYDEEVYRFAKKIIEEFNPDVMHICHPRRVASFIKAAIDLNKKYIITFTDSFMICPNQFLFTKSCEICRGSHIDDICSKQCGYDKDIIKNNRILAKEYISNAYALIAPSEFQARVYQGFFYRNINIIGHGSEVIEGTKEEKVYPKSKLIFGFNGNSNALKGLNIALLAFSKLININVELHVYGNCDDTVRIIAGNNIKFFGAYENNQISNILGNIDVLICPSIGYESYSFVALEALANRVPVIATNEGGLKELIKNCINGFTFEVGDVDQLAEIIKNIYNNQNVIANLSENLKNYKLKTISKEMEQYEDIYTKCINIYIKHKVHKSLTANMWEELINIRYNTNDIYKYMKYIDEALEKYNYSATIDMKYRFIIRIKNMESVLKEKKNKSVVIWGAGTSGILTIYIVKKLYSDIYIKFVVDKYKENESIEEIPIKNINTIKNEDFDYMLICTYPGKKEADGMMDRLNKKVNIDYNYGICIQ